MVTYHLLVGNPTPGHSLKTKLVSADVLADCDGPEDFFIGGTVESVEDRGTVEISGPATSMLGDFYEESDV